jgi:hypothetical protein
MNLEDIDSIKYASKHISTIPNVESATFFNSDSLFDDTVLPQHFRQKKYSKDSNWPTRRT